MTSMSVQSVDERMRKLRNSDDSVTEALFLNLNRQEVPTLRAPESQEASDCQCAPSVSVIQNCSFSRRAVTTTFGRMIKASRTDRGW